MLNKVNIACLTCVLLTGCAREDQSSFAVIDGKPLAQSEVKQIVLVQARMFELRGGKIRKNQFADWCNTTAAKIIPGLVSARLIDTAARSAGIKPTQEDVDAVLAGYNSACGKQKLSVDELAALFGDEREMFLELFARSVRKKAFERINLAVDVSDGEVAAELEQRTNALQIAIQIDGTAKTNGAAAWKRLCSGEDWNKVAAECSEDRLVDPANEDFALEWATVDGTGMGYPELAKVLPSLKEGDFSKPIEIEEGLVIVRATEVENGRWTLARMLFRMAEPVEVPSPEEVRSEIAREKAVNAQIELLKQLMAKATITYPLGTNFTVKIWQ